MATPNSTTQTAPAQEKITLDTVTAHDANTGLPVVLLRPMVAAAIRRNHPIVITIYPEDLREAPKRERNQSEGVIAEIIEAHPGISRTCILKRAKYEYETILSDDHIHNAMRKNRPLRVEGFYYDKAEKGYFPPKD